MSLYLGIDFGTSGARGVIIDDDGQILASMRYSWTDHVQNWFSCWREGLWCLLGQIPGDLRGNIQAIAINGTSSTILLTDSAGNPIDVPLLYNDDRAISVLERLRIVAPPHHTVLSATSSLAKLLWMQELPSFTNINYFANSPIYLLHQADWLAFLLHGKIGISDYHNALKLGYDVEKLEYPQWLQNLDIQVNLPEVLTPGTPIGELLPQIVAEFGFSKHCYLCAGTTDSIAAFLASGANLPGQGVTSLGSTLVLKLLSRTRVEDARYGIYSHRLGDLWLTGGASNTGGAVLRHFFSDDQLVKLSQEINIDKDCDLEYYPLLKMGDRFPINDPFLAPKLTPRPDNDRDFLHGLLTGMAKIEARGYELLEMLGADKLNYVYTAGGGANNNTWIEIRKRFLKTNVVASIHTEAAYGTAKLVIGNW